MNIKDEKIPNNLNECFDRLREILLKSEDEEWFKNSSEDVVVLESHHGLGQWIRNNWRLWDKDSALYKYFNKLGLWHADDMSTLIIRSFYRITHNKELELNKQIETFLNNWKEHEKKYGPTQKK